MRGPEWRFENQESFREAIEICKGELPADSWYAVHTQKRIVFQSIKTEEMFSIAKAVAGSQR